MIRKLIFYLQNFICRSLQTDRMFKVRKCTILRIVLVHVELDVSNISQKRWESTFSLLVATVWELRTPAAELLGEECCLIQDSSCSTVLGLLSCIFHVMIQ